MVLKMVGKIAGMLVLGSALTGCIDATVDVTVTSETTARATLTQVMGADFYAMVKMGADGEGEGESADSFCAEGVLTENADGGATCVIVEEGPFEELQSLGDEQNALTFTAAGAGLVRVSLNTAEIMGDMGTDEEFDAETMQMIEAFFTGHSFTLRVSGAEVTETNMELAADKKSAAIVLPFLDLLKGTADLPEELFSVVRVP